MFVGFHVSVSEGNFTLNCCVGEKAVWCYELGRARGTKTRILSWLFSYVVVKFALPMLEEWWKCLCRLLVTPCRHYLGNVLLAKTNPIVT